LQGQDDKNNHNSLHGRISSSTNCDSRVTFELFVLFNFLSSVPYLHFILDTHQDFVCNAQVVNRKVLLPDYRFPRPTSTHIAIKVKLISAINYNTRLQLHTLRSRSCSTEGGGWVNRKSRRVSDAVTAHRLFDSASVSLSFLSFFSLSS